MRPCVIAVIKNNIADRIEIDQLIDKLTGFLSTDSSYTFDRLISFDTKFAMRD